MVAGHLREKDGIYHIVLSYNNENGKRKSTCRSTHLPVKGNKKRAEALLQQARREMEETLQCQELAKRQALEPQRTPIFFTDFLKDWLNMMKPSLELTTYAAYKNAIEKQIVLEIKSVNNKNFFLSAGVRLFSGLALHSANIATSSCTLIGWRSNL